MKGLKNFLTLFAIAALAMALFTACGGKEGKYKIINISEDKDFIESCPTQADAGETITVKIASVTDAVSYVRVNEDPDFGAFVDDCTYVFVMPEEDVAVKAGFTTQGITGAETIDESTTETAAGTEEKQEPVTETETETEAKAETESETETATGSESIETTSAPAAGYNILEGASEVVSDDIVYFYGNDFLLIMPNNDEWAYEQLSDNSFLIYHVAARNSGYGGDLVAITAYDPDDDSYMMHPHYQDAGYGVNVGKHFIATYPTDVRYDWNDAAQTESYRNLYDYLAKIGAGAVNSPFQTADGD